MKEKERREALALADEAIERKQQLLVWSFKAGSKDEINDPDLGLVLGFIEQKGWTLERMSWYYPPEIVFSAVGVFLFRAS